MSNWKFRPGRHVVKPNGYPFPGIVLVAYHTASTGDERVVVEFCADDGLGPPTGLQHIFSPDQLVADERFEAKGAYTQEMTDRFTEEQFGRPVDRLTPSEHRVYEAVTDGRKNRQIAQELGVTERTVKAHRRAVMEKLGVTSLAALVTIRVTGEDAP